MEGECTACRPHPSLGLHVCLWSLEEKVPSLWGWR